MKRYFCYRKNYILAGVLTVVLCCMIMDSAWAEMGEFATVGPQFLLKKGDFRQLAIVIVVLCLCLWAISHVFKDDNKKDKNGK